MSSIFVGLNVGSGGGTTAPAGAPGAIQFNDSGAFGGFGDYDGANLKLTSDLITANSIVALSLGTFVDPISGGFLRPGPNDGETELVDPISLDFGPIQTLYERYGIGSPEGVVVAPVGAIYHRVDGGTGSAIYVKQSGVGNTGWVLPLFSTSPGLPVLKRKIADQTIISNTALQNDTDLFFPMEANSVYAVQLFILCQSVSAVADWRWNVTVPLLASFVYGPGAIGTTLKWNPTLIGTAAIALEVALVPWTSGSGNNVLQGVALFGIATCGATPGNLQLQWAQNTSTPSNSTVKANSLLHYQKVL